MSRTVVSPGSIALSVTPKVMRLPGVRSRRIASGAIIVGFGPWMTPWPGALSETAFSVVANPTS